MAPYPDARVSPKGAARWSRGHPWIYASDVLTAPSQPGIVAVSERNGKFLGLALCSPRSEIRLRLLHRSPDIIDQGWWRGAIQRAVSTREAIDATAYRVLHGEGDGIPALIIDRYDRWIVVQILSAALETVRSDLLAAINDVLAPEGVLLRNDVPVRRLEGLPEEVVLAAGSVPDEIEVREGTVRFLVAPWTGQKTGAYLDQRPNRERAGHLTPVGGRALDCFSYHGSFALHLAARAASVVAVDESAEALSRGARNAEINGFHHITWRQGDAFDVLRELERARERFDLVVVDPPAFAKTKSAVPAALRGYKEINLRAMKILAPGGVLVSASCSFHVRRPEFLGAIAEAAADSNRRLTILEHLGQGLDHPEIVTIPETGYLKGIILRAE